MPALGSPVAVPVHLQIHARFSIRLNANMPCASNLHIVQMQIDNVVNLLQREFRVTLSLCIIFHQKL